MFEETTPQTIGIIDKILLLYYLLIQKKLVLSKAIAAKLDYVFIDGINFTVTYISSFSSKYSYYRFSGVGVNGTRNEFK